MTETIQQTINERQKEVKNFLQIAEMVFTALGQRLNDKTARQASIDVAYVYDLGIWAGFGIDTDGKEK